MLPFFNTILAPFTVEDFFNNYHEKAVLFIQRNDPRYYNTILTTGEISDYLDRQDIFYPCLRIVKNGKEIPSAEYTLKSVPIGHHRKDGIINTDKAFALFNAGATFVIQAGQRYFEPLSHCCLQLSKKFNAPVQANLYITPEKSQGFHPHWDTHDVFVLQVSGTKTWHLYGFEKELPTKNQSFVSKDYDKQPLQTLQLRSGDFLYVPRGYVHDAVADDGISAHITIGILSFTWIRYFNEIFTQFENIKEFREAIPFWNENLDDIVKEKIETLKQTLSSLDRKQGFERLTKSYHKAQPQPLSGFFQSILNDNAISDDTVFSLNEGVIFEFTETGTGSQLHFLDKSIGVSDKTKPVMDYIFRSRKFTMPDLPGCIEKTDKRKLLIRLIREGAVYIEKL